MIHALFRVREQTLGWLVGLLILLTAGADVAHACACESISPAQGFARAQYVFTGKVVDTTTGHTWTVDVDRVWKGADKLAAQVRLLDVYNGIDCEFYFEPGRTYVFFADVAKSSRYVYYQPEVCNWTRAMRSTRVKGPHGAVWLEDLIVTDHGPGETPRGEDPWERVPEHSGAPGGKTAAKKIHSNPFALRSVQCDTRHRKPFLARGDCEALVESHEFQ